MLTRQILIQGLKLVKLKSSFRKFYGRHHDLVTEFLCHMTTICSACSNHNFVLSSFMNYIRVCNGGNTTGAKNGTGTNCPSGYNRFYLVGFELLYRQFSVQCFFPKSSCPFDHIHLAIVLSVILLTLLITHLIYVCFSY